jgi:hypothetical protein
VCALCRPYDDQSYMCINLETIRDQAPKITEDHQIQYLTLLTNDIY